MSLFSSLSYFLKKVGYNFWSRVSCSQCWLLTLHISSDKLGHLILLPLCPKCQDYRHESLTLLITYSLCLDTGVWYPLRSSIQQLTLMDAETLIQTLNIEYWWLLGRSGGRIVAVLHFYQFVVNLPLSDSLGTVMIFNTTSLIIKLKSLQLNLIIFYFFYTETLKFLFNILSVFLLPWVSQKYKQ